AGVDWSLGSYWTVDAGTTVDKMHADIHDFLIWGGFLYVANDGGVNQQDMGAVDPDWDEIWAGLNITEFYKIGYDFTESASHTLLGAQDNGEMRYTGYNGSTTFEVLYT